MCTCAIAFLNTSSHHQKKVGLNTRSILPLCCSTRNTIYNTVPSCFTSHSITKTVTKASKKNFKKTINL